VPFGTVGRISVRFSKLQFLDKSKPENTIPATGYKFLIYENPNFSTVVFYYVWLLTLVGSRL
jgi:hypothetical protein